MAVTCGRSGAAFRSEFSPLTLPGVLGIRQVVQFGESTLLS